MDIDVSGYNNAHQMGGSAMHSIAHFLGRWALLILLAWNSHAASSRLAQRPKKRTLAGRISAYQRISLRRRTACCTKPLLHLECVQLRFLG